MKQYLDIFSALVVFVMALSFLILLDIQLSVSVYPLALLIYTLFWIGISILQLAKRRWPAVIAVVALWLVAATAVYTTNWNSRKPFLKQYQQIEMGMTAAEVDALMTPYTVQTSTERSIYQHTTEGWGDADLVIIEYENGRVSQTAFYPD